MPEISRFYGIIMSALVNRMGPTASGGTARELATRRRTSSSVEGSAPGVMEFAMRIVRHAADMGGHKGGHKIAITFDNGVAKLVDLAPHLAGEIFEPLKDERVFAQFQVDKDTDTISWPNGADFSPDWLYRVGIDASSLSHSA